MNTFGAYTDEDVTDHGEVNMEEKRLLSEESEMRRRTVEAVRQIMHRDDACNVIVPSDLRILIGEIDRLRSVVRNVRSEVETIFTN
jgi:hypothetical protein